RSLKPGHGERDAMPAESERVDQGPLQLHPPCLVRDVVQVAVRIRILQVDGRGNDPMSYRKRRRDCGRRSRSPDEMADHRLLRAGTEAICMGPEYRSERVRLYPIVEGGGRAVNVDILDILGAPAGIPKGELHGLYGSEPVGLRSRQMMRIAGHTNT